MKNSKLSYKETQVACYISFAIQAVVVNFPPLLYVTFQQQYGLTLEKLATVSAVLFAIPILINIISPHIANRTGPRAWMVSAHLICLLGCVCLGVLPRKIDTFTGLLIASSLNGTGYTMIEIMANPIIEGSHDGKSSVAITLLHSFYCWGYAFTIVVSTLFFVLAGTEKWYLLAFIWAIVPLLNSLFFLKVPICEIPSSTKELFNSSLIHSPIFWLCAAMIFFAGAAEVSVSQWASAFAETGLNVSKTVGDLAGPSLFAILMGTSRIVYIKVNNKVDLKYFMIISSFLCCLCYLTAALSRSPVIALIGCGMVGLTVGITWPGTYALASNVCPVTGVQLFSLLSISGNLGCVCGPYFVAFVSDMFGGRLQSGLLAATVFPAILLVCTVLCFRLSKKRGLRV